MKEQPNYYAIIPANVRYDKKLPAGAKLMYGEITALSNQKGYCFASNGYFAELYGCTKQAISKWIKLLERFGYVNISYFESNGQQQRRVSISVDRYQLELIGVSTGVDHNNTSNNKDIVGKPDISAFKEVVDYLNAKLGTKYRASTKATQRKISARLNEGFTIDDFKRVIDIKSAKWGNDPKMQDYLRPETLFGTKFESYLNESENKVTAANSDEALKDAELPSNVQASYNAYIDFVQTKCPTLYRSETRILTQSEYLRMATLQDQPGAKMIPHTARNRMLVQAHEKLENDTWLRRKYADVYTLYKQAIRAELNHEKSPI